jgi:hypothetical protein
MNPGQSVSGHRFSDAASFHGMESALAAALSLRRQLKPDSLSENFGMPEGMP